MDSYNLPVDFDAFNLDFEGLLPMQAVMFHSGLPTTEPQVSFSTMAEVDTVTLESPDATEKEWSSPKTSLCPTAPVSISPRLSLIQPSRNVHDMLIAHFDRKTCGILSIKDGPVENPWRTLILPLSDGSRAVEHAITCMAAFHGAYDSPDLYTHGTVDMDKSYKCLALEEKRQPLIPALAAWVGLAFAEGWKTPTMSRLTPMVNARRLLAERLTANRSSMSLTKTDTARLKYVINAFVFVHTIGGITTRSEEEASPLPPQVVSFLTPSPDEARMETDPLLACAASLFPLIDNVVSIVQKARRTHRNSLTLVGRASEVYEQLQQWQPPRFSVMESFEDQTQVIQHSIQTAQALRYATLLHLHQAVPEIPSETSAELARKVLLKLASIPSSSAVTNLHIFPLLAASGELTDPEDRERAEQRWHAIIGRLRVKNVDTCWDIVQATWARRDIHEAENVPAGLRADFEMDPACKVRGKLHWLNVMGDRNWQVFVG
ncbi:unnamed protein product [Clonostachys rosea f. rosea IK726]|uniref:Uncharacterized protein n=1 Tax=Clonostachys rosea f. rosea IK726 TaxID=1349383 RepID=A0ACA9UCX3_BIOOC|nr:unnamed protein product [Clonostachys rosea f. rosea IK726]